MRRRAPSRFEEGPKGRITDVLRWGVLQVLALGLFLCSAVAGADPARDAAWTRADRENDFKGLVGDRKLYEFCYATAFVSEACARYRVTGTNLPEYWPDPKVPPIRWPEAPRESVYRPGMSRGEYFEALCKAEAGEFIFRTVRADSIYMIRPRAEEDDAMGSRYGFEDPYGHGQGDTGDKAAWSLLGTGEGFFTEYGSPDYRVVETPTVRVTISPVRRKNFDPELFKDPGAAKIRRYFYPDPRPKRLYGFAVQHTNDLQSRYGYTWRGIRRPYDRELGIAGGELAVVDLRTNEILGLRRGFAMAGKQKTGGVSWLGGWACPHYSQMPGLGMQRKRDKDVDYTKLFLTKVVIPSTEFMPGQDFELAAHKARLEARNQEGLPTLVLKPEEFDSAMSAMASSLERKYGPAEQYHEKLRKQGYPIDDYLARKAGRGGVR